MEVEEGEPAAAPVTAVAIRLAPEVLASYVGEYELSSTFSIVVTVENGGLFVQATGQGKLGASAESETKFFLSAVDAQFTFTKDDSGTVTGMILHQGGRDQEAEKVR